MNLYLTNQIGEKNISGSVKIYQLNDRRKQKLNIRFIWNRMIDLKKKMIQKIFI